MQAWASSLEQAIGPEFAASVQYHMQYGDLTLASGVVGLSQRQPPVAATPDTVYRLCSVTKAFTALLATQQAALGVVHLDDPLVKYWPDFVMLDPFEGTNGTTITLRHLGSHMAGNVPHARCRVMSSTHSESGVVSRWSAPATLTCRRNPATTI